MSYKKIFVTITKQIRESALVFSIVYWVFIALLLLAVQPLKTYAWNNVIKQADKAMLSRQFDLAILEYQKLRFIHFTDKRPDEMIRLANNGKSSILFLKEFYIEHQSQTNIDLISQATATYPAPDVATGKCQDLASRNEAQLALACLNKTTTTWPTYRDSWVTEYYLETDSAKKAVIRAKIIQLDPTIQLD